MNTLVLRLNDEAAAQLSNHTRIRVKVQKRGGVEYVGLRPSYRVSGKNSMVRAEQGTDRVTTLQIPNEIQETEKLPELKVGSKYLMVDIGYCWFIMKEAVGGEDESVALITVEADQPQAAPEPKGAEAAADTNSTDGGTQQEELGGVMHAVAERVSTPAEAGAGDVTETQVRGVA